MKNFSSSFPNHRHPPPPPPGGRKPYQPHDHHNHHHQRPNFQRPPFTNQSRRCYPPPPPAAVASTTSRSDFLRHPNFIIQLLRDSDSPPSPSPDTLRSLISGLDHPPESSKFYAAGRNVVASLLFREWSHTLSSVVSLWRSRLGGSLQFIPNLISNVLVPSDMEELQDSLRTAFSDHIKGLMEGEMVKKWQKKIDEKSDEIAAVSGQMGKRHNSYGGFFGLTDTRKALSMERSMISKRLKEFKAGLRSLLGCLEFVEEQEEEEGEEEEEEEGEGGVEVFNFKAVAWKRIHRLIMRECRRLEDGLPIYAHRQEILSTIHGEQVSE